jgi:hypothetical protein
LRKNNVLRYHRPVSVCKRYNSGNSYLMIRPPRRTTKMTPASKKLITDDRGSTKSKVKKLTIAEQSRIWEQSFDSLCQKMGIKPGDQSSSSSSGSSGSSTSTISTQIADAPNNQIITEAVK